LQFDKFDKSNSGNLALKEIIIAAIVWIAKYMDACPASCIA
jgi:hypothetical protein